LSFGFSVLENLQSIPRDRYDALWNRKDKYFTDIFCMEMVSIRFHWENFCT